MRGWPRHGFDPWGGREIVQAHREFAMKGLRPAFGRREFRRRFREFAIARASMVPRAQNFPRGSREFAFHNGEIDWVTAEIAGERLHAILERRALPLNLRVVGSCVGACRSWGRRTTIVEAEYDQSCDGGQGLAGGCNPFSGRGTSDRAQVYCRSRLGAAAARVGVHPSRVAVTRLCGRGTALVRLGTSFDASVYYHSSVGVRALKAHAVGC